MIDQGEGLVQVHGLHKEFGRTVAVDQVTFGFDRGQIFGFVGPNGAGKTTTMRVLATLEIPTWGEATIDGISVVRYPEKVRERVGYVPDLLPTHSDVTVHEYLDFYARAYSLRGDERAAAVEGVEEFTNLLGIRDKTLKSLSKGMKQRVNLGRALIHDPDVLILDEPAAGLDPRARVELRELLSLLAFDQNKAVLISSHILTELTEICNGVVIIERGKLLETGTIDEITKRSRGFQAETQSHHVILRIRSLDGPDRLRRDLLESPHVNDPPRVVGDRGGNWSSTAARRSRPGSWPTSCSGASGSASSIPTRRIWRTSSCASPKGRCSECWLSGQWSVVSGQWAVISSQWSV